MSARKKNPQVDEFLRKARMWQAESKKLRQILQKHPLAEGLKWGKPCYTFGESNVAIIQGFKEYVALMFCKGVLLKDARGLLIKPGASTQAGRQLRFTHLQEIVELEPVVSAYVAEAIAAEKAGLKVEFKTNPEPVPAELQKKFAKTPALKTAFKALTPGRQRGYILYFSAAKQSQTREARIEKCAPQILKGLGLNDR